MKQRIDIQGVLIPNDYKFVYDFFGEDSTCPRDVRTVLDGAQPNDEIEVYINSGGGVIDVGSEIYTMLRSRSDVKIFITGQACSAASVVAMAGYCEMSPTALMMVHCVSTGVSGNHNTMEHMADVLRTADKALCTAYMDKTGKSESEVLDMMENETWLTAEQAKANGLIDEIMFREEEKFPIVASLQFKLPTAETLERIRTMQLKSDESKTDESVFLLQQKYNFLKLRGERK